MHPMKIPAARLILALHLAASLPSVPLVAAELKGTPEELVAHLAGLPQIVSLVGESEVKVAADQAEVTIKVTTEDKSLPMALRQNQEIRGRLSTWLKENGVSADQIQAARFSTTQKHGPFAEKAKSHRIDHFLKITVQDEKEFQAVTTTVDRWPEVQFIGVEVVHSGKEAVKARAQAQALEKAGERKKVYEEKLGVKLVVKRFTESATEPSSGARRAAYYGMQYSSAGGGFDKTTSIPARGELSPESGATVAGFGELVFTARVTVDYAVEPR